VLVNVTKVVLTKSRPNRVLNRQTMSGADCPSSLLDEQGRRCT
jgi:hypothetical protein